MENPNLTIKERREEKRLEKLQKREVIETKKTKSRGFLWIGLLAILAAIVFGLIALVKRAPGGEDSAVTILESVNSSDWIRGNQNASTTLIEYGDFECPACAIYYPYVKQLEAEFGKDV